MLRCSGAHTSLNLSLAWNLLHSVRMSAVAGTRRTSPAWRPRSRMSSGWRRRVPHFGEGRQRRHELRQALRTAHFVHLLLRVGDRTQFEQRAHHCVHLLRSTFPRFRTRSSCANTR